MLSRPARLLLACACLSLVVEPAPAQSRRGRGRPGGSLSFVLFQPDVRKALNVTDEQLDAVQDVNGEMLEAFRDLRGIEGEDERRAARERIQREAEQKIREILDDEQFRGLRRIQLQRTGPSALLRADLAKELGIDLDEEARKKLAEISESRREAFRELGFRASDEERRQVRAEYDQKLLSVLNEEQRKAWQAQVGADESDAVAEATSDEPAGDAPPAAEEAGPEKSEGAEFDPKREVVASFGQPPESAVPDAARTFSFTFSNAPWRLVLEEFAEAAGMNLDIDALPPGAFTYIDDNEYTPTEALDVLNGKLLQMGYVLVKRDEFLVSLDVSQGIPPNLVPNVDVEHLSRRGKNEILSVVIPLDGIDAETAAEEVEALLGPQGKVSPVSSTNSVVVTDIGSNLRRVNRLLSGVTKRDPAATEFRAFHLEHIDAQDAEQIVRSQLGLGSGVQNVAGRGRRGDDDDDDRRRRWREMMERFRRRGDDDDDRGSSSSRSSIRTSSQAQVTANLRTNSLLVTATVAELDIVEQVLEAVDVESNGVRVVNPEDDVPVLRAYKVTDSDAGEVAKTIDAVMPGVVVNEDHDDKLHVFATPFVHREVEAMIRQLDTGAGSQGVAVIPLARMDPAAAAGTLRSLFVRDGDQAPTVEADVYGRRLLVRGSSDQIAQIRSVLSDLGEDGSGDPGANRQTGPVRTIGIGGRDPEEFLPLLEKMWNASSDAPIRVVRPRQRSSFERRLPGGRLDQERPSDDEPRSPDSPEDDAETGAREPNTEARGNRRLPASPFVNASLQDVVDEREIDTGEATVPKSDDETTDEAGDGESPDEPAAEGASTQPAEGDGSVAVTVSGDSLILVSPDDEKLNRLESMAQTLAQMIPPKTRWTVFYLQSADALEAATMLEQLFPSSSVSTSLGGTDDGLLSALTGGVTSMGSSLMDASGLSGVGLGPQSLRIVPDLRSNSLFVTGPTHQIDDVEQVLEILDASELPQTYRDRLPRMIPVEHADVVEVEQIVKETFHDYMEDPRQSRGRGRNPLAQLMGGGGGGGNGRQEQGVRLTVSADTQTNQLVVSAREDLFRQVEGLVEQIDQSAKEANRTIRVVTLENANTQIVSQALGSLMPKVRVSTTGAPRRSTRPDVGGPPNGGFPRGDDGRGDRGDRGGDFVREMIQRRLRERFLQQQGGGNGPPRGDGRRGDDRGRGDRDGGDRGDRGRFRRGGFGRGRGR